jgi:biotin carboxylase
MSRRCIVLVGRRNAALRAARAMDLEVIRIDGSAAPPARRSALAHLPWPAMPETPSVWSGIAEKLRGEGPVAAVVALTEAAVLPAARLRAELRVPGMDVATALRCTDKLAMKTAIRAAGLPCADFLECRPELTARGLVDALGLPILLKPRTGSGGRGHRLIREERELTERWPSGMLAERFLEGIELSSEALLAGGAVLFENATEYLRVREASVVPGPLRADVAAGVAALQLRALAALGVEHGIVHTEIFLTTLGPVFGEMAARPPGGHIMRLIELAYGFDPWQAWLRLQLGESPDLEHSARQTAGAWVLHEGEGRVRSISGLEAVRRMPGVDTAQLRVGAGDRVGPRLGSGDEIGHLIVVGRDRDEVAARLVAARAALRIEMDR